MGRGTCLDENAIGAFVAGQLADADAAAVDAHIDACADCLALMVALANAKTITRSSDPGENEDAIPSSDALARGARIGRYQIVSLVGAGAMGAVYAAIDPDLQ